MDNDAPKCKREREIWSSMRENASCKTVFIVLFHFLRKKKRVKEKKRIPVHCCSLWNKNSNAMTAKKNKTKEMNEILCSKCDKRELQYHFAQKESWERKILGANTERNKTEKRKHFLTRKFEMEFQSSLRPSSSSLQPYLSNASTHQ